MTTPPSPIRRLASQPTFRRWAVANLFARLPLTMNLLVLVLVGEAVTGSVATGATLAGAATLSAGLTAQLRGRRLDRVELNRGLRQDLLLSCVAVVAILTATLLRAPVPVLLALAVLMGVAYAAVLGGFRALLVRSVPPGVLEAANAIDAVFVEVAFVMGPAVAGALALLLPPSAILGLMAIAFAVSIPLTAGLPTRDARTRGTKPVGPNPLRTRGATPIYLIAIGLGVTLGGFEALIPARMASFGLDAEAAGPMLALTALGSGVVGVVAANRSNQLRRGRIVAGALMLALALGVVPAALAPGLVLLGLVMFAVGLPIAPLNALASYALQRIVPEPRQAEGFSLFTATILIGAGSGQFAVGQLLGTMTAESLLLGLSAVPLVLGPVALGAAARRRAQGMPPGLGADHDPDVADPRSWAAAVG